MFGRAAHLQHVRLRSRAVPQEKISSWYDADVGALQIHQAMKQSHDYTGSYSALRHIPLALRVESVVRATTILAFVPVRIFA